MLVLQIAPVATPMKNRLVIIPVNVQHAML